MRHVERIIGMIRTGAYPQAEIDRLITEEASTVVEQVVTSASPAGVRRHVVAYTRAVYAAAAAIVKREVELRTKAALDAADAVARRRGQHDEAVRLVRDLLDGHPGCESFRRGDCCTFDSLTDEQRAAIERAPIFVARVLVGGDSVTHALDLLARREEQVEALKAKAVGGTVGA